MIAGRWIRIVLLGGVSAAAIIGTLLWWQTRGLKVVEDRLVAGMRREP
jgi:hypothetical protein